MTPVLLRTAGINAFGPNAQADPPDGKAAETGQARRGEGRTVIGADGLRQRSRKRL